jgi:hypothetical protein
MLPIGNRNGRRTAAGGAIASAGQQPPPIEAPMGTIPVVEGTVQMVSEDARTVVVKTVDGIKYRST